jgi:CubicO group peptidase (beta-lactamase class C family)
MEAAAGSSMGSSRGVDNANDIALIGDQFIRYCEERLMPKRLTVCMAVLSVVIASGDQAFGREQASLVAAIDSIVHQTFEASSRAGMSVAVMEHGQLILARGYGYANVELAVPATEQSVYHICSISKHITAAAILQLAEEGKVSLDDDITQFVPNAPVQGHRVLLRHLLSHTSGMESYTSLGEEFESKARLDLPHDSVLALVRNKPFHFDPGEEWRYCNTGWYLLGLVIEKVSGQSYADYMKEHVFEPLGMTQTQYGSNEPLIHGRAQGYDRSDGKLVNAEIMSWEVPFAGGGLCSTVLDLVKFETALNTHQLIGAKSLDLMRTPTKLSDGTRVDYGFGTRLGEFEGHRVTGHTGNGGGFQNVLAYYPDDDLMIVILSNTDAGVLTAEAMIARQILDSHPAPRKDLKLSKKDASLFCGMWESDEGRWEMHRVNGNVYGRPAGSPDQGVPATYQGKGVFRLSDLEEVKYLITKGTSHRSQYYAGGMLMDVMTRMR